MKRLLSVLLCTTALAITGCSGNSTAHDSSDQSDNVTLTVMAAASLQESFDEIAADFTAENPGVVIDVNYAGSSTLVQNLDAGAPADILATADEASMDIAEGSALIDLDSRTIFAANTLVGIVPANNPASVTSLEQATAADVNLVVCAPQVPCGALSQAVAEAKGITLEPVSEEHQVSDVLGKVRSGQADAGLVYATDAALAAQEVTVFDIEGADEMFNYYPIARTSSTEDAAVSDQFIEHVLSDRGQAILAAHGFAAP